MRLKKKISRNILVIILIFITTNISILNPINSKSDPVTIRTDSKAVFNPVIEFTLSDKMLYILNSDGLSKVDPSNLETKWERKNDAGILRGLFIQDGTIFWGKKYKSTDLPAELFAVDLITGEEKWSNPIHPNYALDLFVNEDLVISGGYGLYVFNRKDGQVMTQKLYPSSLDQPILTDGLIVCKNTFISSNTFSSFSLESGLNFQTTNQTIHSIKAMGMDGQEKWSTTCSQGSFFINKGIIYYTGRKRFGYLYGKDLSTGETKLEYKVHDDPRVVKIVNDTLFFLDKKYLYSFNVILNSENWRYQLKTDKVAACFSFTNDSLSFWTTNQKIYTININNGNEEWNYIVDGKINSNPLIVNDMVYIPRQDNSLSAINLISKKEEWRFKTKGLIKNIQADESNLYLLDDKGNLYVISQE